jgi:EF-hand domain pair
MSIITGEPEGADMIGLALGLAAVTGNVLNSSTKSTTKDQTDQLFQLLDTDKDGQVTAGEFMVSGQVLQSPPANNAEATSGSTGSASERRALFKAMDTNGDGKLSREEVAAYSGQRTAARAALLSIQEQFNGGTGVQAGRRRHHHQDATAQAVNATGAAQAATSPAAAAATGVTAAAAA